MSMESTIGGPFEDRHEAGAAGTPPETTAPAQLLTWENRPYWTDREHFQHRDGRRITAVNPRVEMTGHEDGSPYATIVFDHIEVNGEDATEDEQDELWDDLRKALRDQIDWSD